MKLWKYNNYDNNIGGVPIGASYKEPFVYSSTQPDVDYTETIDNLEIDEFIEKNKDIFNSFKIYTLVSNDIKNKNIIDINYKIELKSNVKLHAVHRFTDDGFSSLSEFYNGYIDSNNKGELILIVEETYDTHPNDSLLNPTARRVISRTKTRKWVNGDGDIDTLNVKVTTKLYDTMNKRNDEGVRRRNNIINILVGHTGMGGVLSGAFSDETDANNKLISIMEYYADLISSWIKTGQGTLIENMIDDSILEHNWLDTVVPDTMQTQMMTPFMIGITLRDYIVDKLKGIIE